MANTINSTYAGSAAGEYILPALVGNDTWNTKGVSIHEKVKFKKTVKKFSSSGLVKAYSDGFTDAGDQTISEVTLQPKAFSVQKQWGLSEFKETWDIDSVPGGIENGLPAELEAAIIKSITDNVAADIDLATWQSTGSTKFNEGFLLQLSGCSIHVTGATVTVANVGAALQKLVGALPAALKGKIEDLVIYMSRADAQNYRFYEMGLGNNTTADAQVLRFAGIEIVPISLPDSTMVCGERKNFHLATDLASDSNNVKLVFMADTTADNYVRFRLDAAVDFKVGYCDEIVVFNNPHE